LTQHTPWHRGQHTRPISADIPIARRLRNPQLGSTRPPAAAAASLVVTRQVVMGDSPQNKTIRLNSSQPSDRTVTEFISLNFISKILDFTMQINAYQEDTKINTGVNEQPLKNIGTHWNKRTRHR